MSLTVGAHVHESYCRLSVCLSSLFSGLWLVSCFRIAKSAISNSLKLRYTTSSFDNYHLRMLNIIIGKWSSSVKGV